MSVAAVMVVVGVGAWLLLAEDDKLSRFVLFVFLEYFHHAGRNVDGPFTAGTLGGAKLRRFDGEGVFPKIEILPEQGVDLTASQAAA